MAKLLLTVVLVSLIGCATTPPVNSGGGCYILPTQYDRVCDDPFYSGYCGNFG